jgi:hypothetical protein
MGKKKSKVSKQKQAKAKQRHASLGGVVVCKGSKSKFQQSSRLYQLQTPSQVILHNSIINNNSSNNNNHETNTTSMIHTSSANTKILSSSRRITVRKELINKQTKSQHRIHQPNTKVTLQPRLESIQEDQEQQDFDQQLASLQERQWITEHKKAGSSNGSSCAGRKRNKNQRAAVGNDDISSNNVASPKTGMFGNMPPASFQVEKSTQDLLQETMHKMVHLRGVGISAVETTPIRSNKTVVPSTGGHVLPNPSESTLSRSSLVLDVLPNQISSGLSSLPVIIKQQQEPPPAPFYREYSSDNPYAALGRDDSDDEDDDDNNHNKTDNDNRTSSCITHKDWSLKIQAPLLNFAPSSFSLMPRQTPTPASTPIPSHRQPVELHQQPFATENRPCSFASTVTTKTPPSHEISENILSQEEIDPDL